MKSKNLSHIVKIDKQSSNIEELIVSGVFYNATTYFLNHSEDFKQKDITSLDDMITKIDSGKLIIDSDKITGSEFIDVFNALIRDKYAPFMISDVEKIIRFYKKVMEHKVLGTVLSGTSLIEIKNPPHYFECVTEVAKDQQLSYLEKVDSIFITIDRVLKDLPNLIENMPNNFQFIFIYFTEMFKSISTSKEKMEALLNQIPNINNMTTSEIISKLIRRVNSDYVNEKMMPSFMKNYLGYTGIPQIEIDSLVYQISFQYKLKQPYSRKIMDHAILKASNIDIDKQLKDEFYQYLIKQKIITREGHVYNELTSDQEDALIEYLLKHFKQRVGTSKEFLIHDYHRSRSPLTKGSSKFYNYFNMANNFSVVMDLLLDYLNKVKSEDNFILNTIEGKIIIKEWLDPYYDFTMFHEAETFFISSHNNAVGITSPLSQAARVNNINLIALMPESFNLFKGFAQAADRIDIAPGFRNLLFVNGVATLLTNGKKNPVSIKKRNIVNPDFTNNYGEVTFKNKVIVNNMVNSIEGLYHNRSDIGLVKMEYIMNSSVMDLPSTDAYQLYYGLAIEKAKKQVAISLIDIVGKYDFRGYSATDEADDGLVINGIAWEIKNAHLNNLHNQLLAIITLAQRYPEKEIEIIIPKVRNIEEIKYFQKVLEEALLEVQESVNTPKNIHIGMMIETLTLVNDQEFNLYKLAKPFEININNKYLKLSDDIKEDKSLKQIIMEYIDSQELLDNNGYPIRLFTDADAVSLKRFIESIYEEPNEPLYILLKDILIGACQGFINKRHNYLDNLFNQQHIIRKLEQILMVQGANDKPLIDRIVIGSNRLDKSIKGQLKGMRQEGSYSYIFFIIMRNISETLNKINRMRQYSPAKITIVGRSASDELFIPVMLNYFQDSELSFATKEASTFETIKKIIEQEDLDVVDQLIQEIIDKKSSTYDILQKLDHLLYTDFK